MPAYYIVIIWKAIVTALVRVKRTVRPIKKNLYYSFNFDENLHTYVKPKIKWGNHHALFSIFLIENELITENVKNGVCSNECSGWMVQPTQLIRISFEAEFRALQNYREFFFSNLTLVFELNLFFFQKNVFCLKN